jgi:hypothetical protein
MANHCTNCGHELREGEKFWAKYGARVAEQVMMQTPVQATGYRRITPC